MYISINLNVTQIIQFTANQLTLLPTIDIMHANI